MVTFNWLHLTDLHWGMESSLASWSNIEEVFLPDLEDSLKTFTKDEKLDLVLFTGDLTQKGEAAQFSDFNDKFLKRLWDVFEKQKVNPVFLAVPGNHDLSRRDESEYKEDKNLYQKFKDQSFTTDFWKDDRHPDRLLVNQVFKNFSNWWETLPSYIQKPRNFKSGLLPGDFAATIEKSGVKLGIIGLNSAFLQLAKGEFKGKLLLSPDQVFKVCGPHLDWKKQHAASLLLTHHPPDWLINDSNPQESPSQTTFEREISPSERFAAHLFGHMHANESLSVSRGGALPRHSFQGCSLWGVERYYNGKMIERRHGYMLGQIKLEKDTGEMVLWPRHITTQASGGWRVIPDHGHFNLPDGSNKTKPFSFKVLNLDPKNHNSLQNSPQDILELQRNPQIPGSSIQPNQSEKLNLTGLEQGAKPAPYKHQADSIKPSEAPTHQTSDKKEFSSIQSSGNSTFSLEPIEFLERKVDRFGNEIDSIPRIGKIFREHLGKGIDLEMMEIPSGFYLMGKDNDFWQSNSNLPVHAVRISRFLIGRLQVTVQQWNLVAESFELVKREIPGKVSTPEEELFPITDVKWYEANEFCARLSKKTGRKYLLPTESQWEYACRAGTRTLVHFGQEVVTSLINYNGNYPNVTGDKGINRKRPTQCGGLKAPNAYGLEDMHGNVRELCLDFWSNNYENAPNDSSAFDVNNEFIVIRGGAYTTWPQLCSSSSREEWGKDKGQQDIGFRVAMAHPDGPDNAELNNIQFGLDDLTQEERSWFNQISSKQNTGGYQLLGLVPAHKYSLTSLWQKRLIQTTEHKEDDLWQNKPSKLRLSTNVILILTPLGKKLLEKK